MALEKEPEVIFARLIEEGVFEEIQEEPNELRATVEFVENLKVAIERFDMSKAEDEDDVRVGILLLAYMEHMYERNPVTREELMEAVSYLKAYYDVNKLKRLDEWVMLMRLRRT